MPQVSARAGWMFAGLIVLAAASGLAAWLGTAVEEDRAPPPLVMPETAPSLVAGWSLPSLDAAGPEPLYPERFADSKPPPELAVVVLDRALSRVSGARVEFYEDLESIGRGAPLGTVLTDAFGGVCVQPPRGTAHMLATKDGVGTSLVSSRARFLILQPHAVVRGVVLDGEGRPAPGARVEFRTKPRRPGQDLGARTPAPCVTDALGRFKTFADGDLDLTLKATHADFASERTIPTASGEEVEVVLRLSRWGVAGSLQGPSGQALTAGEVTAWRHPESDRTAGIPPHLEPFRATVDVQLDGRFELNLPGAGEYVLVGRTSKSSPAVSKLVRIDDTVPRVETTLRLPVRGEIRGRLLGADGRALRGVRVHASPEPQRDGLGSDVGLTASDLWGEADDETDDDGRFLLVGLHPQGRYGVWCWPDPARVGHQVGVPDVAPFGKDLLLFATEDQRHAGWVEGLVLSEATGRPVTRFRPTLVIRLGERVVDLEKPVVETHDGRFRIGGLAEGERYALRISATGHGAVETPWWRVGSAGHELEIQLPPPGSLAAEVVDRWHQPLAGIPLTATLRSDFPRAGVPTGGVTNAQGLARFSSLAPGPYVVETPCAGGALRDEVIVTGGHETPLRIVLSED